MATTNKRARGGNNSTSYQEANRRELMAPVSAWKKEWVIPNGMPPDSSFKVLKWVNTGRKVDLTRNYPPGHFENVAQEAAVEDLDDIGDGDEGDEDEADDEGLVKEDKMFVDGDGDAKPLVVEASRTGQEDGLVDQPMPAGLPPPGTARAGGHIPESVEGHDDSHQKEVMEDDAPTIIIGGTDSPARAPGATESTSTPSKLTIPASSATIKASPRSRSKSPSAQPSPSRMTRSRSNTLTPNPERLAHIAEIGGLAIPAPEVPVMEIDPLAIGNLPSPGLEESQKITDPVAAQSRAPSNAIEMKVISGLSPDINTQFGETLTKEALEARAPNEINDPNVFALGTRSSQLALIQTSLVAASLSILHPTSGFTFPVVPMSVAGDRNKTTPLHLLSTSTSTGTPAKALWTEELEDALLAGNLDAIVHSCKDVPTVLPERCELGAMLKREDPRDALVVKRGLPYKSLADLPEGSLVGTGSVRRIAQLKKYYPGLRTTDVRGNLDTRFRKLDDPSGPYTAIILAAAGVERMSLSERITCLLGAPEMYHAVSQGAIAIEIRSGDARVKNMIKGVGHWETEWRVGAERGLLRELEGGCSVPVGVETVLVEVSAAEEGGLKNPFETESVIPADADPILYHSGFGRAACLHVKACVTSLDGSRQVAHDAGPVLIKSWKQAEEWGRLVARTLIEKGASTILDEINAIRHERERQEIAGAAERLAATSPLPEVEGAPPMQFTDLARTAHAKAKEDAVEEVQMEGTTDAAAVLGEGDPVGAGGEKDPQDEDFESGMEVDS